MMIFFIIIIIFYSTLYVNSAKKSSQNLKSSNDFATLAVTLADLDSAMIDSDITMFDSDSTALAEVQRIFVNYEKMLMTNIGLNNDFSFNNSGTLAFCGPFVASGNFRIDSFDLYNTTLQADYGNAKVYTVTRYTISNVSSYTEYPVISSEDAGTITVDSKTNKVTYSLAEDDLGNALEGPTVITTVSFPIKGPAFLSSNSLTNTVYFDDDGNVVENTSSTPTYSYKVNELINGTYRLTKRSETSVKWRDTT